MEEDSVMASAAEEGEAESRRRPRDLLRRLGSVGNCREESAEANGADSDEIELSLGLSLSLGGCSGPYSDSDPNPNPNLNLNPKGKIKLSRSSSLASFSPFAAAGDNASSLVRTCSLPTETEEERRKRKEMQSLKRLQAKRKRLERRNSIKSAGSARDTGEDSDHPIPIPIPIPISFNGCRRHHRILTSRPPEWPPFPLISQASSVGSQGSCSFSSAADFDIKAPAAAAAAAVAAEGNDSSFEIQPLPDNINHKIAATPPTAPTRTETNCSTGQENPIRTLSGRTDSVRKNIMEDMPCVSTKGDGPNGRRIEGFLFKFEKVEDLRIVCVCHGSFLSPAEFVKHAGGGDVAHPLKHIVVNPSPSSLLS